MQKTTVHKWSLFRNEGCLILQGTLTVHKGEKNPSVTLEEDYSKKRKCNEFLIPISNLRNPKGTDTQFHLQEY